MDSAEAYFAEALECEMKAAKAEGHEARQIHLHTATLWRALAQETKELESRNHHSQAFLT
jgi:hypothetical protein